MSQRNCLFSISDVIIFTYITFEAKQARNGLPTEFRSSREKRSKDVCEWDLESFICSSVDVRSASESSTAMTFPHCYKKRPPLLSFLLGLSFQCDARTFLRLPEDRS